MKSEEKQNKLDAITVGESKWAEEARWRIANEAWLDKSAEIALKVLRALRASAMTQTMLAKKLNVSPQQISKIVKGSENLTLETICRLESVLNVELVTVDGYYSTVKMTSTNKIEKPFRPVDSYYAFIDIKLAGTKQKAIVCKNSYESLHETETELASVA